MVTFRNNNRRPNFRRNDRNFKRNTDGPKYKSNFSQNDNFQRKVPGRNNHNAPKLIEKYNDLAREALANEDKILSENYFQHADHFTRILSEQEKKRPINSIDENKFDRSEEKTPEKQVLKSEDKSEIKKSEPEKTVANN